MASTEFFAPCVDDFAICFDCNRCFVTLYIGCNRACAHVRLVSENGIADIVEVRNLNAVEQNAVLQLARVSHNRAFSDDSRTAYECAVAYFRARVDDARTVDTGTRCDYGVFGNVNSVASIIIKRRIQVLAKFDDVILDFVEQLPRICVADENLCGNGVRSIEQPLYLWDCLIHKALLSVCILPEKRTIHILYHMWA